MESLEIPQDDSYLLMTDSQRKEMTKIRQRIKTVKRLIATEQEVLKEAPITSYKLERAEQSVKFHSKRLEEFKESYLKTLATLEENAAAAEAALQKERDHLMNAQKSKALIRAEIELKELEEHQKTLFGSPENTLEGVKPSPGFSSVAEEIAEMNRQQLERRANPPHPSNTDAPRIRRLSNAPEQVPHPEGSIPGVQVLRQKPFGGLPVADTKQISAPPPPPPAKKPPKSVQKRPAFKEVGPGVSCYKAPEE
jgi:hypothetical protein